MSSRDRNSRRRPAPRSAAPDRADEAYYEDDVFYGGDWREDEVLEEDVIDYGAPPVRQQQPASRQPGTAAQINQLQQSIGRRPETSDTGRLPTSRTQPSRPEDDPYADVPAPRAAPRTRSQQPGPARREIPQVDHVEYDDVDDDYYAPYTEYEDDFSEYDAPRRNERTPRARPSVPAIKRPSLPPAIANADLMNDAPALAMIGTGVAGLVAMAIVVGNQAGNLAPEFATHVSASGILENFRSERAFWNLPIMATAFMLMNVIIAWFTAPIDRFASRFAIAAALLVQVVIWVAVIRIL